MPEKKMFYYFCSALNLVPSYFKAWFILFWSHSLMPVYRQVEITAYGRQGIQDLNMVKYTVYAIKSEVDNRIYVGFSTDVVKRLKEHNSGKTKSTKGYRPWKLIFQKNVSSKPEARQIEKYYKSGIGKEFLKSLK